MGVLIILGMKSYSGPGWNSCFLCFLPKMNCASRLKQFVTPSWSTWLLFIYYFIPFYKKENLHSLLECSINPFSYTSQGGILWKLCDASLQVSCNLTLLPFREHKRVGPTIRIRYLKGVWSPWKVTLVFERFYLCEGVSIFFPIIGACQW